MMSDLLFIGALDVSLQRLIGKKARWFQLHSLVNFVITVLTLPDVIYAFQEPLKIAMTEVNPTANRISVMLHVYHMLAFRNLTKMDYVHHILSAFLVGIPSGIFYTNKLLNATNFFICGLPGCINYACLTAVKNGKMAKLTEKQINSYLNAYLRQPGLLYCIFLNMLAQRYNLGTSVPRWLNMYAPILIFWNATFFSYEAIYNYGINSKRK